VGAWSSCNRWGSVGHRSRGICTVKRSVGAGSLWKSGDRASHIEVRRRQKVSRITVGGHVNHPVLMNDSVADQTGSGVMTTYDYEEEYIYI
jgi:hypothetical protein